MKNEIRTREALSCFFHRDEVESIINHIKIMEMDECLKRANLTLKALEHAEAQRQRNRSRAINREPTRTTQQGRRPRELY